MHHLRLHLRPRRRRPGRRHSPRNRFRRPPARLDMPSLRRRQGTLREGEITPHRTTMSVFESPNQHPRRKTSHFFCKDSHPARYHVRNSPHFKLPQDTTQRKLLKTLRRGTEPRSRALPRTRRKENIPKLCVAAQNHAAEHSRGRDAKKTSRHSASRHRTTQQSTPKDTTQRKRKETVETPLPLYLSSYLETLEC